MTHRQLTFYDFNHKFVILLPNQISSIPVIFTSLSGISLSTVICQSFSPLANFLYLIYHQILPILYLISWLYLIDTISIKVILTNLSSDLLKQSPLLAITFPLFFQALLYNATNVIILNNASIFLKSLQWLPSGAYSGKQKIAVFQRFT